MPCERRNLGMTQGNDRAEMSTPRLGWGSASQPPCSKLPAELRCHSALAAVKAGRQAVKRRLLPRKEKYYPWRQKPSDFIMCQSVLYISDFCFKGYHLGKWDRFSLAWKFLLSKGITRKVQYIGKLQGTAIQPYFDFIDKKQINSKWIKLLDHYLSNNTKQKIY